MARVLSLVAVVLVVPLAAAACGGGGPDRDSYVRANEALLNQLPSYPGAKLRETVSEPARAEEAGPVVGYTTRHEFVLPEGTQAEDVASFYRQRLNADWRLVERLDGPVLNYRNGHAGVSINLEGWRGRQLELTVDHNYYRSAPA